MSLFFKNAQIIDPENKSIAQGGVLVEGGKISKIFDADTKEPKAQKVIDCKGKHLAPGIVDLGVKICEPGERHKESFASAGRAAAAGGVTTMVIRPDTEPAIDTPEILEFVHRRAVADSIVKVEPMAAITKGRAGTEMAEIGFLKDAGAVAFNDCDAVIRDTKVLMRCLSYAKGLGALVMLHAQEPILSDGAAATSGAFASKLGLPAVSTLAERLELDRILALAGATGASVHIDQITTEAAIPALKRARAKGLDISAGASIHHLTLNEFDVDGYRTFFKVKPPLRPETDRIAIADALANGDIDILSSMHTPQDEESKRLPFDLAASGAVGLETLLPAALSLYHSELIDLASLWATMSYNPAKRLGLNSGRMAQGAPADLVVFDADKPFQLDRTKLKSKSKNTPFDGRNMQGRVMSTFVNGEQVYAHS